MRAVVHALTLASAALVLTVTLSPSSAEEAVVVPVSLPAEVLEKRQEFHVANTPALTPELLQAYVARKQQLASFDGFDLAPPAPELTEAVLLGYISRQQNNALDAIERADFTRKPALNAEVLSAYVSSDFVPTVKRVKLAESEKLCLTQAIYHEARGESLEGQMAVANVIINRAFSKKYPSTICGVVFQNADKGRYKCQFTFACDGRSDMGTERAAWKRSAELAERAFYEFQRGDTPGVVPKSTLYYHTTAVAPSWSNSFRRVASIGAHIFYSSN